MWPAGARDRGFSYSVLDVGADGPHRRGFKPFRQPPGPRPERAHRRSTSSPGLGHRGARGPTNYTRIFPGGQRPARAESPARSPRRRRSWCSTSRPASLDFGNQALVLARIRDLRAREGFRASWLSNPRPRSRPQWSRPASPSSPTAACGAIGAPCRGRHRPRCCRRDLPHRRCWSSRRRPGPHASGVPAWGRFAVLSRAAARPGRFSVDLNAFFSSVNRKSTSPEMSTSPGGKRLWRATLFAQATEGRHGIDFFNWRGQRCSPGATCCWRQAPCGNPAPAETRIRVNVFAKPARTSRIYAAAGERFSSPGNGLAVEIQFHAELAPPGQPLLSGSRGARCRHRASRRRSTMRSLRAGRGRGRPTVIIVAGGRQRNGLQRADGAAGDQLVCRHYPRPRRGWWTQPRPPRMRWLLYKMLAAGRGCNKGDYKVVPGRRPARRGPHAGRAARGAAARRRDDESAPVQLSSCAREGFKSFRGGRPTWFGRRTFAGRHLGHAAVGAAEIADTASCAYLQAVHRRLIGWSADAANRAEAARRSSQGTSRSNVDVAADSVEAGVGPKGGPRQG